MAIKVMSPMFRASYAQLFTPRAIEEGKDPVYSVTMLFPKNEKGLLDKMRKAAKEAIAEKWGNKPPKGLKSPFRDADKEAEETDDDVSPGYEGMIFVRASSKDKPGLVDKNREAIIDASEFYSGCYARATLAAFAYDTKGNRGVTFFLNNVQKLKDGERLDGRSSAEDDFDEWEDDGDDYEDDDIL